jgi:hypothetical protein
MDDGGGDVDHRFETAVCLVASHCYAFEFFQFAEEILDQVALFVNVRVDVKRFGAPGLARPFSKSWVLPNSNATSMCREKDDFFIGGRR